MMETQPQSIVLGGGCFWCLDAAYRLIRGVTSVTSGFAGGETPYPTYEAVVMGSTGHAEVVKVEFNFQEIVLETILDIFWTLHDPTTLNRQGHDMGSQYRSIILYNSEFQLKTVRHSIERAKKVWGDGIVTEVKALTDFYPADDYHQNFFANNPEKSYCQIIINPKLKYLREKFTSLLK
ncbi:MAG TPA: peptide-methionine (S)-S-oxide reductase MsrA [Candidatus Saccharimonadales bacterium]|nr:peptide-methionine (S)-S-oxide reductase MsrA [Candidatus Saccharimonadales bacterium]